MIQEAGEKSMNEERIAYINTNAQKHLEDWLAQLDNEEVSADDLLAALYGGMIAADLLGYQIEHVVSDAKIAADKIRNLAEESQDNG